MAATCGIDGESFFANFSGVFAIIGGLTVACFGLRCLYYIYHILTTYVFAGIPNLKKYGEWAVITGATDGIGKAYAQQLARKGLNIILISRTQEKLQDVAAELESLNSGIKTKIIAADFTEGWSLRDKIQKGLEGLDIGILVNNVGMGYTHPEYFLEIPNQEQFVKDMMALNVTSTILMTQICLPRMVEKKKGLVISVSSASGTIPTPLLTVYSAGKAFVDFFTDCLNTEYSPKGVHFQSLTPYFITTKLSKIRRPSLFIPTPTKYVRAALATVGRVSRTTGYLPHQIQADLAAKMPRWVLDRIGQVVLGGARRAALKKLQKKD